MTYDQSTLTVSPTKASDEGIYSILVKQQVFQGSTNHLVNEQTLEVEVKCAVTNIAQNTAINSLIETTRSYSIGTSQTLAPRFDVTPNDCSNLVTDMTVDLTLENGDPLPSFIKLVGTFPLVSVEMADGALSEALKTYNFIVTVTDNLSGVSDSTFSFSVEVIPPCGSTTLTVEEPIK